MDYLSKPGFLSILAGVACGVCLGWGIRGRFLRQHRAMAASAGSCGTEANVMGESGEFKMVLIDQILWKMSLKYGFQSFRRGKQAQKKPNFSPTSDFLWLSCCLGSRAWF